MSTTPDGGPSTNQFLVNDIRLYLSGPVAGDLKFMFNTDYNSSTNTINVLDAVARIEVSPEFNIWAGRLLPPSDRANLYGPFYAHEWNVYSDGVQDGYPGVYQGRDNGAVY
ncbi:MAG: porin, partial [Bryobacteraceae bacterium]